MLKILLKKQLTEIFRGFFFDQKKRKARSKEATIALLIGYMVLMLGMMGGMFTMMSLSICEPLVAMQMDWLYFTIAGTIALVLGVFGSVFNTYAGLYLGKDNDLLLSMPIPVRYILAARLLGVYLMGLLFSAVVMIPAGIVYMVTAPLSFGTVYGPILLLLLISLLVLVLSCVLGWGVARVSIKLKNKSYITVIAALVFIALYYVVYFNAIKLIENLIANAQALGGSIQAYAYPLYFLARTGTGEWLPALVSTAVVCLLGALTYLLLSRSFFKIAAMAGVVSKIKYKEKAAHIRTQATALLCREFKRFTSSPNYMLNCGLGVLMLPILAVVLLIKGGTLVQALDNTFGGVPSATITAVCCAGICMAVATIDTAAPSVSLEGKHIWIVQSMPIEPWLVLRAKLLVQILLTAPMALFVSVCAAAVFRPALPELILLLLLPQICAGTLGLFDLFIGLRRANLNWTNELYPIKQSFGVFMALFGGWGYAALLGGGAVLLAAYIPPLLYMILFAAVSLLLDLLMIRWLRTRGCTAFAAL